MNLGNLKYFFTLTGNIAWKLTIVLLIITLPETDGGVLHSNTANLGKGIVYIAFQDTLSVSKLKEEEPAALRMPISLNESIMAQVAYMQNCQACHGADRMGTAAPSLFNLNNRISFKDFKTIIIAGRAQMPGFRLLEDPTIIAIYKYLSALPTNRPSGRRVGRDTIQ